MSLLLEPHRRVRPISVVLVSSSCSSSLSDVRPQGRPLTRTGSPLRFLGRGSTLPAPALARKQPSPHTQSETRPRTRSLSGRKRRPPAEQLSDAMKEFEHEAILLSDGRSSKRESCRIHVGQSGSQ